MMANALRLGIGAVFSVLAVCFTGLGLFIAAKVSGEHNDSPGSTYLLVGGIVLLIAVCLAVAACGLIRKRPTYVSPALILCAVVLVALFGLTTSPLFLLGFVVFLPLAALAFLVTPVEGDQPR